MKALGMYVFCGSMSIGVMESGFNVDRVLELSDEMLEQNAKHFIHNYPGIPIITPSEWDNITYKNQLYKEQYDLLYGNPPCSGLSQINRHASADNDINKYMNKFIDMVAYIEPKTFLMENAPTLISKGRPILDYLVSILGNDYYLHIIRDYASNHKVPMRRQRTMIIGFRRNVFKGIPTIDNYEETSGTVTASEVLAQLEGTLENPIAHINWKYVPERTCKDLETLYDIVPEGKSVIYTLATKFTEDEIKDMRILSEKRKEQILKIKNKLKEGKGVFDKSPNKIPKDGLAPSLTSVTELIHPKYNRPLFIREYAKLMGYPDDFEFVEDSGVPYIQAIAQGVPVNFVKWAATNIKDILEDKHAYYTNLEHNNEEVTIIIENRCNMNNIKFKYFTKTEFLNSDNIC